MIDVRPPRRVYLSIFEAEGHKEEDERRITYHHTDEIDYWIRRCRNLEEALSELESETDHP